MAFKCGYLSGGLWIGNNTKSVFPCCYTDNKIYRDKINTVYHNDILNNHLLKEMRKSAIEGKPHLLCQGCLDSEKNHNFSPRLDSINPESRKLFKNTGDVKIEVTPADIERLYISLGNVCNYKCIMCSEGQSHLIAKEKNPNVASLQLNNLAFNTLLSDISQMKNLKSINITGGEPFLNKTKFLEVLEKLPKHVIIQPVHTNGSIYDTEILDKLSKFKFVDICFSFDGFGKGFEYQRPNSNWDTCLDNLQKMHSNYQKYYDNIVLTNAYTATAFTIDLIPDFLHNYRNYFHNMKFYVVKGPVEWQINLLTPEYLFKILDQIEYFIHRERFKNYFKELSKIKYEIQQAIISDVDQKIIDKFWNQVQYMKEYRNVDIHDMVPHLVKHFKR